MWFVSEKKYKRLLEENEDLKNLYNNLKVRFISLNEEYCSFRLAQKEEKKKARGEVYLLNENEKLTDEVIFEYECDNNTIKKTVEEAVKRSIDLTFADLKRANLSGANLKAAKLNNVDLDFADLSDADF